MSRFVGLFAGAAGLAGLAALIALAYWLSRRSRRLAGVVPPGTEGFEKAYMAAKQTTRQLGAGMAAIEIKHDAAQREALTRHQGELLTMRTDIASRLAKLDASKEPDSVVLQRRSNYEKHIRELDGDIEVVKAWLERD